MIQRIHLLAFLSLGLLLGLDSLGTARQTKQAQKAAKQEQKAAQTKTHATLIGELREIHSRLANADHDYKGHRAKAMQHIHNATHALHKELGHHDKKAAEQIKLATLQAAATNSPLPPQDPTAKQPLPQATSDAQLQKAAADLKGISQQVLLLSKGPYHGVVLDEINSAVSELGTALKIR